MADEENFNVAENDTNEVIETKIITEEQDIISNINNFDWNKVWDITKMILNYSSIVLAYLGVLAILSYPLLHIVNEFCGIENFMKKLPLGYTVSLSNAGTDGNGFSTAVLFTFGVICIFVGLKLVIWLLQKNSIVSRIFCILLGSGFMYLMIDQQANNILMGCLVIIVGIVLLIFVGIPCFIMIHNCFLPIFKGMGIVPSIFTYFKFLLGFFPKTSGLMKFCDSAKNSVETTNARYAEENRKYQEEYDRKNEEYKAQQAEYEHKKEIEKQERETIGSAIQQGNVVNVYNTKGNLMFTKYGILRGYTSSTVNIEYNRAITTYNGRGNSIITRTAK